MLAPSNWARRNVHGTYLHSARIEQPASYINIEARARGVGVCACKAKYLGRQQQQRVHKHIYPRGTLFFFCAIEAGSEQQSLAHAHTQRSAADTNWCTKYNVEESNRPRSTATGKCWLLCMVRILSERESTPPCNNAAMQCNICAPQHTHCNVDLTTTARIFLSGMYFSSSKTCS